MDISQIEKIISQEWTVITSAPISFVAAVVVVGILIWFVIRFFLRSEIDGLKATIATQNERISLSRDRLDHYQRQIVELEREIDKSREALPVVNSVAMKHSLAASTIASDVRVGIESTAAELDPKYARIFEKVHAREIKKRQRE